MCRDAVMHNMQKIFNGIQSQIKKFASYAVMLKPLGGPHYQLVNIGSVG